MMMMMTMMMMMMMMEGNDDDDDSDALRLVGGKQERRNGELRFRKGSKDLDWCQVVMITDCLDNDDDNGDDDDDDDDIFSDHLPDYPNGLVNVNFGMHGCIHLGTQLSAQVLIMILIIMNPTLIMMMASQL